MKINVNISISDIQGLELLKEVMKVAKGEDVNVEISQTTSQTTPSLTHPSNNTPVNPTYVTAQTTQPTQITSAAQNPPTQITSVTQTPPVQQVPTASVNYTLEDLQSASSALAQAGRTGELYSVLQQFNVASITMLPQERYAEFALKIRELGAAI